MLAQKKTIPEKLLLRALSGQPTPQIPFWLMRQAGRYLPEYRELRQKAGSFLDLCFNPVWATEVTLQPIRRFDMDAAILFSDILVVPHALGQRLDFVEGEGPRLAVFDKVSTLGKFDDSKLQPVYETVSRARSALAPDKALIGFAGAPWTVACYMMQGQGDGAFNKAKQFAFSQPAEFDLLIERLVEATSCYLLQQIKHGADAVQIFDSWAGLLPEAYFERWVIRPTQIIVSNVRKTHPGFPVIGFPRQAGTLYKAYAEKTGVSCIGLDQYQPLAAVIKNMHGTVAVQGNLDPVFLLGGGVEMENEVKRILAEAGQAPFVFNLGHGIIKETSPAHVEQLSTLIRAYRR